MQNELLWVGLLLINFLGVLLAYKFFGKKGLYIWTAMSVILANIQVMKTIEIFGYVTAMGNIIYSSLFLSTDILCENHGKKEARRVVWMGFFVLIFTTIIMQTTLYFIPHSSDSVTPALQQIFSFLPRIAIASLTAYLISQNFDVWFYSVMKKKTKHIWLRNNLSTMISQFIDNIIFTWIAFVGFFGLFGWGQEFPWPVVISIFATSYVLKWIVAIADTPFVYLAKRMKKD